MYKATYEPILISREKTQNHHITRFIHILLYADCAQLECLSHRG